MATTRSAASSQWPSAESIDNYGGWMIVNANNNTVEAGEKFNLSDEEVERFLAES